MVDAETSSPNTQACISAGETCAFNDINLPALHQCSALCDVIDRPKWQPHT
ncbi:hypothetical protein YpsIP31758_0810 [Yersinia pseudotuberculosis IP 31758]|uniref:Uncharacterized protein n=1 Tax=Yersinia pseudotuberculosis serotype O:1b (strain IP 31758) TaxID=349747 RepID=A0A0U1R036_YERP3|nr:hypothetical protein YpsIP31758_0810 [Yersinia pseudotuberculosis IP 31758]